jgi:hypothetical protein
MGNFGLLEIILILIVFTIFIATPIYLAWYFIRSAKFKEKILLMDKGIDIKDLNVSGNNKTTFPWLRIGIIITGVALGALIVALANLTGGEGEALILLCTGLSFILAYFVGGNKEQSK